MIEAQPKMTQIWDARGVRQFWPVSLHHDFTLDTDVLHVPLIIQVSRGRGRRLAGLASHLDILPTLANLVGQEPDPEWLGESLVAALAADGAPQKDLLYSMFYIPEDVGRGRDGIRMLGVRTQGLLEFRRAFIGQCCPMS